MKAGFAKLDITPPVGIELAGYGYFLERKSKSLHDPLFARALAFESGSKRALMISCDLVGFEKKLVEDVKSEIASSAGVDREGILIHCTHTHSGPATAAMRGCGVDDPEYVEALKLKLVQVGLEAIGNLLSVDSIRYVESDFEGIGINRTQNDIKPIDHTVRNLLIQRTGADSIVLVNYACHPVVNGINNDISADYPGELALALEEQGYECAFLNGFSGDINPVGSRDYDTMARLGRRIAEDVVDSLECTEPLSDTSLRFGIRNIRLPLDILPKAEITEEMESAKSRLEANPKDMFALQAVSWLADALSAVENPNFPGYVETYLQAIAVGDVIFVAFPGETFTAFGLALREKFPQLRLLTVNSSNGLVGYITTIDDFDHHGYASYDAARIYNTFTFARGFGEYMCSEAAELVAQICTS